MTTKKNTGYNNEEIADALFLPRKLNLKQQAQAALQLAEARKKKQQQLGNIDILTANLLQLRFNLEDYVRNENFNSQKTFGFFLKAYLHLIQKKRNEFAAEIDIHETLLSQLINDRREPGQHILIRLEIHSNNAIPASYWYCLIEKKRKYHIDTNKALRKEERKFVKNRLTVSL